MLLSLKVFGNKMNFTRVWIPRFTSSVWFRFAKPWRRLTKLLVWNFLCYQTLKTRSLRVWRARCAWILLRKAPYWIYDTQRILQSPPQRPTRLFSKHNTRAWTGDPTHRPLPKWLGCSFSLSLSQTTKTEEQIQRTLKYMFPSGVWRYAETNTATKCLGDARKMSWLPLE